MMAHPAQHVGIRHIQDIFRQHADRLYHGADDRLVPTDNHLAARELRPTVMARKISIGSQPNAGGQMRGILMSVLHPLEKRRVDVGAHLQAVLDELATDLR